MAHHRPIAGTMCNNCHATTRLCAHYSFNSATDICRVCSLVWCQVWHTPPPLQMSPAVLKYYAFEFHFYMALSGGATSSLLIEMKSTTWVRGVVCNEYTPVTRHKFTINIFNHKISSTRKWNRRIHVENSSQHINPYGGMNDGFILVGLEDLCVSSRFAKRCSRLF